MRKVKILGWGEIPKLPDSYFYMYNPFIKRFWASPLCIGTLSKETFYPLI